MQSKPETYRKIENVLVSQPAPTDFEKSPYGELAVKYGVKFTFRKLFKVEGVTSSDFRKDKVKITEHTAVVFTSKNAIDHFFRLVKEMRIEVSNDMKYFCISETVAFYLQTYIQFRKRKIFFAKQTIQDLMEIISKHKDEKFVLPCSDVQGQSITKYLDKQRIKYSKAIIYNTPPDDLSDLDIGQFDMIIFFSPSGVKSLVANFPDFKQNSTLFGAYGESTIEALKETKFALHVKAPTKAFPSIFMALDQFLQKSNK